MRMAYMWAALWDNSANQVRHSPFSRTFSCKGSIFLTKIEFLKEKSIQLSARISQIISSYYLFSLLTPCNIHSLMLIFRMRNTSVCSWKSHLASKHIITWFNLIKTLDAYAFLWVLWQTYCTEKLYIYYLNVDTNIIMNIYNRNY